MFFISVPCSGYSQQHRVHISQDIVNEFKAWCTFHNKRVWSSGYDVRLTRERSWVRSSLPVFLSVLRLGSAFQTVCDTPKLLKSIVAPAGQPSYAASGAVKNWRSQTQDEICFSPHHAISCFFPTRLWSRDTFYGILVQRIRRPNAATILKFWTWSHASDSIFNSQKNVHANSIEA